MIRIDKSNYGKGKAMDENILVEVYLPTVMRYFTLRIATYLTIKEIKGTLCELLEEATQEAYVSTPQIILYDCKKQRIMADDNTLAQLGILNGDKIIIW